jgi:hypothetical protein
MSHSNHSKLRDVRVFFLPSPGFAGEGGSAGSSPQLRGRRCQLFGNREMLGRNC